MSIKNKIANFLDHRALTALDQRFGVEERSLTVTPVFHVERLYEDAHFEVMMEFCQRFREITDRRAVLTCMTPHSPILSHALEETGFSASALWGRIAELGENGLIGLHGHFVRGFDSNQPRPMHCHFVDISQVETQIATELFALVERGLIDEDNLIYSAGWWYTSQILRSHLSQVGFLWDYSVSSSPYNRCQGLDTLQLEKQDGVCVQRFGNRILRSPVAVSSIAKPNRSLACATKIQAEAMRYEHGKCSVSLYSHDYDLHLPSALRAVESIARSRIRFAEPTANGNMTT